MCVVFSLFPLALPLLSKRGQKEKAKKSPRRRQKVALWLLLLLASSFLPSFRLVAWSWWRSRSRLDPPPPPTRRRQDGEAEGGKEQDLLSPPFWLGHWQLLPSTNSSSSLGGRRGPQHVRCDRGPGQRPDGHERGSSGYGGRRKQRRAGGEADNVFGAAVVCCCCCFCSCYYIYYVVVIAVVAIVVAAVAVPA